MAYTLRWRYFLWGQPLSFLLMVAIVLADSPDRIPLSDIEERDSYHENSAQARMTADVQFLSSDEMRGRGPGTGGLDRAADFIARRWQSLQLNTKLFDGSPFQTFTVPGTVEASKPDRNRLKTTFSNGETHHLELDRDFRPLSLGASGRFSGPLVFVGYGISANEKNLRYDDYEGMDVLGKVVIAIRKEPQQSDPKSEFAGTQSSRHALFATKVSNAIRHGAAALILVNDSLSFEKTNLSNGNEPESLPATEDAGRSANSKRTIPTLFVTRRVVENWLNRIQPTTSLKQIEQAIDNDLQPRSMEINDTTIEGEVFLEKTPIQVKNVVASIEGRGALSNETVVIGAHYDHVGMGGPGSLAPGSIDVHNGADDNASGTAALLEITRRFAEDAGDENRPRRRMVFIAFTCEERGLLGSRHYVAHPRFSLESTVAMINLDMVGRMSRKQLVVFGTGSSSKFDSILDVANRNVGLQIRKQVEAMGPSDHQPFFEQRVPVLHLFTGLHNDYHRPSDDFEKINTEGMVWVTDIVYRLGSDLSFRAERPDYIAVKGKANIRIPIDRSETNGP